MTANFSRWYCFILNCYFSYKIANTANFGHIPGTTTGETPITFIVKGTTAITSIDLSSMNKVAVVDCYR